MRIINLSDNAVIDWVYYTAGLLIRQLFFPRSMRKNAETYADGRSFSFGMTAITMSAAR